MLYLFSAIYLKKYALCIRTSRERKNSVDELHELRKSPDRSIEQNQTQNPPDGGILQQVAKANQEKKATDKVIAANNKEKQLQSLVNASDKLSKVSFMSGTDERRIPTQQEVDNFLRKGNSFIKAVKDDVERAKLAKNMLKDIKVGKFDIKWKSGELDAYVIQDAAAWVATYQSGWAKMGANTHGYTNYYAPLDLYYHPTAGVCRRDGTPVEWQRTGAILYVDV